MVKLKRLKIHKFRNVLPGVELRFDDKMNILVGKNATGKTTLLNLISECLRTGLPGSLDEEFDVEFDLAIKDATLAARVWSRLREEPPRSPDPVPQPLGTKSYDLAFDLKSVSPGHSFRVRQNTDGSRDLRISVDQEPEKKKPAFAVGPQGIIPVLLEVHTLFKGATQSSLLLLFGSWYSCKDVLRFDESLNVYTEIVGGGEKSKASPSFMAVYLSGMRQPVTLGDFLPNQICGIFVDRFAAGEPPREFKLEGASAPEFLKKVSGLLEFKDAEVQLSLLEKKKPAAEIEEYTYANLKFWFEKHDGTVISESLLSYGQKRLLAFYYYLAANPNVVIADELVNGFHYNWIEACLTDLGERQAFLTSQNPLLVDFLPLESAEHAQRCFVLCSLKQEEGRERMCWENMPQAKADELYEAYGVGIEHVGEILRKSGLW